MTSYTLTMTISAGYDGPHAPTGPSSSLVQTTLTTATGNNCSLAPKQNAWREELEYGKLPSAFESLSRIGSKSTKLETTQLIRDFKSSIFFWVVAPKNKVLPPASQGFQNSGANAIPRVSSVNGLDLLLLEQLTISDCPTIYSCAGPGSSGVGPKRPRSDGTDKPTRRKKRRSDESNGSNGGGRNGNGNGQGPGETEGALNAEEPQLSSKKFDCLFHKLDPFKYECCEGFILTGWDRVLQHLLRKHLLTGEYCARCRTDFNDNGAEAEVLREEHSRQATCQLATAMETGKLLRIEYDDLTGLGRGSSEEKWFKGWEKLFHLPPPYSPLFEPLFEVRCRNVRETFPGRIEPLLRRLLGYNPEQALLMAFADLAEQSFRESAIPHLAPAQGPISMPSLAGDRPWMQPPQVPPAPPGQDVPDLTLEFASAGPIPPARPPEDSALNTSHLGPRPGQSSQSASETILSAQPYDPSMQPQTAFLQAQDTFVPRQFSDMLSTPDLGVAGGQPVPYEVWHEYVNWHIDQPLTETGDTDNNGPADDIYPHPSQYIN